MKLLLPLLLLASLLPARAEDMQLIDSIVAIVEDDVITTRELVREVARIRQEFSNNNRSLPPEASLNRQVLELMITKSIIHQEAISRGVKVTDTQLNDTLQSLAQRNNLTLAQFREALLGQGIDYNRFRDNLKRELAINKIQGSYAQQNVDVSEQEVDDFMQRTRAANQSLEFRLSHLLIALPDGASSEQVAEARSRIETIASELRAGASFSDLASTHSSGRAALEGGDLGWRKMAEIPSLFADIVPGMNKGDISEPLRSASGFHLVMLSDLRDAEQVLVRQTQARHILIKPDELTSDDEARQKLAEIRQRILDGEDFSALAREHSQDPGSGGLGGDLGWFDDGTMVAEFTEVANNIEIGATSELFRTQFGWHVLQVIGRRTVDETEESKRNKIRAQLQEQKKQEVLDLWQRRLRDQAFVKIFDAS